jgi:hypothetical protein
MPTPQEIDNDWDVIFLQVPKSICWKLICWKSICWK